MRDLSTVQVQYLHDKIFYGTIPCNCSHSLMDRMRVCGTRDPSSILGESTKVKQNHQHVSVGGFVLKSK